MRNTIDVIPMKYAAIFATLLLGMHALCASEDLTSMQKRYDAYQQLPASKGDEMVREFKMSQGSFLEFAEFVESRGIKVALSESVKTKTVSMTLRDFSLKKVIDFVTESVSAKWVYYKKQLVIFNDVSELRGGYKRYAMERETLYYEMLPLLQEKWREAQARAEVEKYNVRETSIVIAHLKIENLPLDEAGNVISMKAREYDPEEKGIHVVTYPGKDSPIINVEYFNKSVSEILDAICSEYGQQWTFENGAVLIRRGVAAPPPVSAQPQGTSENDLKNKIRELSRALRLHDAGDIQDAMSILLALQIQYPNDPKITSILKNIEKDVAGER